MSGFDKTLELQIVFLQVVCIFITIFFLFFEKWYKTLYFSSDTGTNFCFFPKWKMKMYWRLHKKECIYEIPIDESQLEQRNFWKKNYLLFFCWVY